jgi:hypothetical protein
VHVLATGNLKTFSVHLVRSEISAGLHQIVKQLGDGVQAGEAGSLAASRKVNLCGGYRLGCIILASRF